MLSLKEVFYYKSLSMFSCCPDYKCVAQEAMEKNKIDIVNDYLSQISAIQSEDKRVKEELHMVAELMKVRNCNFSEIL